MPSFAIPNGIDGPIDTDRYRLSMSAMASPAQGSETQSRSARARDRALEIASRLFYSKGVRAVGMEEIVASSGIAKTTIYRHFPTKDDLIGAFLAAEDQEFWEQWDEVTKGLDGSGALFALCAWIGSRVQRDEYRGCPQINVAAEFRNEAHPARIVARRHKDEMYRRLIDLCRQTGSESSEQTAMQIALLFDGAFTSSGRLSTMDAPALLTSAVRRLLPLQQE